MKLPVIFLLCTTLSANAVSIRVNYGVGLNEGGISHTVQTAQASLISDLTPYFIQAASVAYFRDSSNSSSPKYYTWGGWYSLGTKVNIGQLKLAAMWGVGGITHPDSKYLGGYLQFRHEVSAMFEDSQHQKSIGMSYIHISSAGISGANAGRDFLTLNLEYGL
jgi:hypothetical protein